MGVISENCGKVTERVLLFDYQQILQWEALDLCTKSTRRAYLYEERFYVVDWVHSVFGAKSGSSPSLSKRAVHSSRA